MSTGCSVVVGNYRFEKNVIDELIMFKWWLNDLDEPRRVIKALQIDHRSTCEHMSGNNNEKF